MKIKLFIILMSTPETMTRQHRYYDENREKIREMFKHESRVMQRIICGRKY